MEKSRIVHQELNERNYHAFYTLLDGAPAEMREKLGLVGTSANYYYTNQGMASAATGAKTAAATSPVGAPVNKDADMADETNNFDRLRVAWCVRMQ